LKAIHTYSVLFISLVLTLLSVNWANAQYLLQASNAGDESNYKWYEAQDTSTVLGTDFFYEVNTPGIYFATYDGTLCGKNATSYFIVTNCNAPHNEVTMNVRDNVTNGATVNWTPAVNGDPLEPTVTATESIIKYIATLTKAGNTIPLPSFTVVCINEAATLADDIVTMDEDTSVIIGIYDNDTDVPTTGTLTTTNPANGTVVVDDNGTPNDPTDDIVTYTPNPNYNGSDSFDYTICNTMGDCSTATVTVDVLPIVDAIDDMVATNEDAPIVISVLNNDNDIPATGTITTTNPINGNIVINDGGTPADISDDTITYTPTTGFTGTDTFTYTLCDRNSNCSTATVTILVNSVAVVDLDSDDDGILDSFEDLNTDGDNDPSTNFTDSDGDGFADYLDIDSDNDGIPDNVEAQLTVDYITPSGDDVNANGVDDAYEQNGNLGIIPEDSDGDLLPDYVDLDSDNDNVPDNIEGHDINQDGIPEAIFIGSDKDDDGLDDGYEGSFTLDTDVNDEINSPVNDLPNTDGYNEVDYRDTDDDDDGILTADEDVNKNGDYADDDEDANGIPSYLDPDIVTTKAPITVFNVVTPNDDGDHDELRIDGLENFPNNTVKIYNRWGVLVFSTKAYNTTGNIFNGTSLGRVTVNQDNKLPVGTYFYIIDYKDRTSTMKSISGYIYINR